MNMRLLDMRSNIGARSPWLLRSLVGVVVLTGGLYAVFGGRLLLAVVGLAGVAVAVAGGPLWTLLAAAGVSAFLSTEPAPFDALAPLIALAVLVGAVRGRWKEWSRQQRIFLGLVAAFAALNGALYLLHPGHQALVYLVVSLYLMALAAAINVVSVSGAALQTLEGLFVGVTLAGSALAMALPAAWADGRLKALTKDANVLGALLAAALVIVAAKLMSRQLRGRALVLWGAACLAGHALLLLTASRGALLGLLAAYGVLILVRRPRVLSVVAVAAATLGTVYVLWAALGAGRAVVAQTGQGSVAPLVTATFESQLEHFRSNDAELSLVNMAVDGKRALRVQGYSGIGRAEQTLPAEMVTDLQNQTLSLSVSVRKEQGSGPVTVGIADDLGTTYETVSADDHQWRRVTVSRPIKSGASWITVVLYGGEMSKERGTAYFDAFQLDKGEPRNWAGVNPASQSAVTEGTSIPFSVIQTDSFEGTALPFKTNEATTRVVSPGKFGQKALEVDGESPIGRIQWNLTDAQVAQVSGRTVTLSAYVRKPTGSAATTIGIADGVGVTYAHPVVGTEWQRVQVTREISPNAGWIVLVLYGGQLDVAPGSAVWDGIQIETGAVATEWLESIPAFRDPPPQQPKTELNGSGTPAADQERSLVVRDGFSFIARRFTESDPGRLAAWSLAMQLIQRFPMGIGPGSFEIYSAGVASVRPDGIAPHNTYLRVLVELGYAGLVIYLLLITWSFRQALRLSNQPASTTSALVVALPAIQVGMYVQGVVIDSLHWRHWWLLIALPFAVSRLAKPHARKADDAAEDGIAP